VVKEPEMLPEVSSRLRALEMSLSALGFRHDEWFKLDDFPATHVSAWQHESRPTTAFILYYPDGGMFRLRFVRRFPSGGVVVTSTRVCDLAYQPPQGIYLQARKWGAPVEQLWAWHLEAEGLFPDATAAPGEPEFVRPRDLFVAVSARWGSLHRRAASVSNPLDAVSASISPEVIARHAIPHRALVLAERSDDRHLDDRRLACLGGACVNGRDRQRRVATIGIGAP
jgi:hypothetical protein